MLLQKEAKQGKGEPGLPLCKPLCRLAVLATDLDFSGEKNPNPYCAQIRSKGSHGVSAPTALRCPKKSSRCSLARFFRPLRVLRLAASATGGARLRIPYPSPVAGEGPSVPIAARSTHRLGIMPSCYRLAETSHKNAPQAPYKRRRVGRNLRLSRTDPTLCFGQPSPLRCILLSPQGLTTLRGPQFYGAYRRVGSLGRSPK